MIAEQERAWTELFSSMKADELRELRDLLLEEIKLRAIRREGLKA